MKSESNRSCKKIIEERKQENRNENEKEMYTNCPFDVFGLRGKPR
jgi:hypothetical protein